MSDLIKRDKQGVERCQRVIDTVAANDPKDPTKGFKPVKAYCNKPMTLSVSENRKICPDCEKQPVVGLPPGFTPRILNAASTPLTPKEMEECGLNPDGTRIDGKPIHEAKAPTQTVEAEQPVEAKVEVKKDEVVLSIPLKDLEGQGDVAAYLIRKVIEGFGTLPTPTYAESKKIMKLEEKLESLLRV